MRNNLYIIMEKKLYIMMMAIALCLLTVSNACAQRLAVKTNLFADALATPNIEVDPLVASRWTTTAVGSIGFCNPRPAIGYAPLLRDIFGASTSWGDVSMWAVFICLYSF